MHAKIREKLEKEYTELTAKSILDNHDENALKNLILFGLKPVKELSDDKILSHGYDCDTCTRHIFSTELRTLVDKNKCPYCLNKIFIF